MELPHTTPAPINLLSVTNLDGPAFNNRSLMHQCLSMDTSTALPDVTPEISRTPDPAPKSLIADRLEALLQIQNTDSFCKRISKCLLNDKAPHHKMDLFLHVRGILYKHITESGQKFLSLVIPKSWIYSFSGSA